MNFRSTSSLVTILAACLWFASPLRADEPLFFIEGGGTSFVGLDNEFGGTAGFGFETPCFGIRATASLYTDDTEYFPPYYGQDYLPTGFYGEADLYRISVDLYAKYDWNAVTLYGGIGISWYSIEATIDFHFARFGYRYDGYVDIEGDSDLCVNAFAGIRIFPIEPFYLFAEARYDIETDLDLKAGDHTIAEFEDLGGVSIVGGIGMRF